MCWWTQQLVNSVTPLHKEKFIHKSPDTKSYLIDRHMNVFPHVPNPVRGKRLNNQYEKKTQ